MKKTQMDGMIGKLFEGKSQNYIECRNVDYRSTRDEAFYDLSLNVKGCKNLIDSFKQYVAIEFLTNDNKYR